MRASFLQTLSRITSGPPIPFAELGAKATADYKGGAIGISPTLAGAELHTGFQKLSGTVTALGLQLTSTDTAGGSLRLTASALGRVGDRMQPLTTTGIVSTTETLVTFTRPDLTEEYSVSVDGVRQDFIIAEAPLGQAARWWLSTRGAARSGNRCGYGGAGWEATLVSDVRFGEDARIRSEPFASPAVDLHRLSSMSVAYSTIP
jgi:hypothetical protein